METHFVYISTKYFRPLAFHIFSARTYVEQPAPVCSGARALLAAAARPLAFAVCRQPGWRRRQLLFFFNHSFSL